MRLFFKIFIIWLTILGIYGAALLFFPHVQKVLPAYLNQSIQILLFIILIFIVLKEPNKKNKFIFLNFALYFVLVFGAFFHDFIGHNFFVPKFSRHYFFQYLTIAYQFFMSIAVTYTVFDSLFREFSTVRKYLLTLIVVGGFFGYYFQNYFTDPKYLYKTEEINQWRTLNAYMEEQKIPNLSTIEVANNINLKTWKNGNAVGELFSDENLHRVEYLFPYLHGTNYQVLLMKPLYQSCIFIDVFIIGFILLFFGYQYKNDPPQGAYIEKIMFLILLITSMDAFHHYGFIMSVEWANWYKIFSAGQYITVLAEIMLILFFALRLHFITSVQGEFYETELATNPQQVSRWRDWIDNLILSQFSNFKLFNGRLFQRPLEK